MDAIAIDPDTGRRNNDIFKQYRWHGLTEAQFAYNAYGNLWKPVPILPPVEGKDIEWLNSTKTFNAPQTQLTSIAFGREWKQIPILLLARRTKGSRVHEQHRFPQRPGSLTDA